MTTSRRPTLIQGAGYWDEAFAEIVESRWAYCPNVIDQASATVLANEADLHWQQSEPEGVAYQNGSGALKALADSTSEVRSFVDQLHRPLDQAARELAGMSLPGFNEANWSHYPTGVGRISAHRDPDDFTGLIAIFTLTGSAPFRVFGSGGSHTEVQASAGDLVLISAHQWPRPDSTCPVHEVGPPMKGDRTILTFRSNRNGPLGGYTVGNAG